MGDIAPNLPPEIILLIISHLANDDLINFSTTCRSFNKLGILQYSANLGLDLSSPDLHLRSDNGASVMLRLLLAAHDFRGRKLRHFAWDALGLRFHYYPELFIEESRRLATWIDRLAGIETATLKISLPERLPYTATEAVHIILSTILAKGCTSFDFTIIDSRSSIPPETNAFGLSPLESIRLRPFQWLWQWFQKNTTYLNDPSRKPQHFPLSPKPTSLTNCFIRRLPLAFRWFIYDMLKYSTETITTLTFKWMFEGPGDFAALLNTFTFPNLREFSIQYGAIYQEPVVKFLSRHPNITTLEYHHIRYIPVPWASPLRPFGADAFTGLQRLIVSPEHLVNFLPDVQQFAKLSSVTLSIEERERFSTPDRALGRLAGCRNPIELVLQIVPTSLGFAAWLTRLDYLDTLSRPERSLTQVERLVLDNGDWGWTEELYHRMLRWLRLFPSLRCVEFRIGERPRQCRFYEHELLCRELKTNCPGLVEVRARGTHEWTHIY